MVITMVDILAEKVRASKHCRFCSKLARDLMTHRGNDIGRAYKSMDATLTALSDALNRLPKEQEQDRKDIEAAILECNRCPFPYKPLVSEYFNIK